MRHLSLLLTASVAACAPSPSPPVDTADGGDFGAADLQDASSHSHLDGGGIGDPPEFDCRTDVARDPEFCSKEPSFARPEKASCRPSPFPNDPTWQCAECHTDEECLASETCWNRSYCWGPEPDGGHGDAALRDAAAPDLDADADRADGGWG